MRFVIAAASAISTVFLLSVSVATATPTTARQSRLDAVQALTRGSGINLVLRDARAVTQVASLDARADAAGGTDDRSTMSPDALLQRGRDNYRSGNYAQAVDDLRAAADGFLSPAQMQTYVNTGRLETLDRFETAMVYLAMSYTKMGREQDAREPLMRIVTAERIAPTYATLNLDSDVADFENVARRLSPSVPLPANTALAALQGGAATPSTTMATTATPTTATPTTTTPTVTTTPATTTTMTATNDTSATMTPATQPAQASATTADTTATSNIPLPQVTPVTPSTTTTTTTAPVQTAELITAQPTPSSTTTTTTDTTATTTTASATSNGPKLAVQPTIPQERAAQEQALQARLAAERAAVQREMEARIAQERAAAEQAAETRIAEERANAEKALQARLAEERQKTEQATAARLAQERQAADQAAQQRIAEIQRQAEARVAAAQRSADERVATAASEARRNLQQTLRQAEAFAENGQIGEANSLYVRLLGSPDVSRETLVAVATGLYRTGDFSHAVTAFQKIGTLAKGEEDLHYYNAVSLYETGHYRDAQKELSCALPFIQVTDEVSRYRAKIEQSAAQQASR